ncbi:MAG: hypothetical protein ACRD2D_09210 [Terriglobales bacterium]
MVINWSMSASLVICATSLGVVMYSLLAFAHVRVTDGDMRELDRLRLDGVLPPASDSDPVAEYYILKDKLMEVAPAVCMRQEQWLKLYYHLLRALQRRGGRKDHAGPLRRELIRLTAYQATNYRQALARMEAVRNPAL